MNVTGNSALRKLKNANLNVNNNNVKSEFTISKKKLFKGNGNILPINNLKKNPLNLNCNFSDKVLLTRMRRSV